MNNAAGRTGQDGRSWTTPAEWLAVLAVIALVHAATLRWIFPGYDDPLWPHHSDMYIPVSLASLEGHWLDLALGQRPVGFLFFKLIGQAGLHGSLLCCLALVMVNIAATAMLVRRWAGLPGFPWFLVATALYAFAVFSHPGYYVLGNWDVFTQLAGLLMLAAAWLLPWHKDPAGQTISIGRAVLLGLLLLAAFMSKETYAASAFVLAGWWALAGPLKRQRLAWLPLVLVVCAAAVSQVLPWLFGGRPLPGSEADYVVSLAPESVWGGWSSYAAQTLRPLTVAVLLTACGTWVLAARSSVAALCAPVLLLAGMLAWLPNALLPNHFFAAYAWNGTTLLFAPLLLMTAAAKASQIITRAGVLVSTVMALAIPSGYAAGYQAQRWVLEQEQMQRRLVQAVGTELGHLRQGQAERVLVTGLVGPFSPFDNGLWQFQHRPELSVTVVVYGAQEKMSRYASRVGRMPDFKFDSDVDLGQYTQVWSFLADGTLHQVTPLDAAVAPPPAQALLYPAVDAARRQRGLIGAFRSELETGTAFLRYAQPAKAIEPLQKAAALDPVNPYPWHFLSVALTSLGKSERAVEASLRAMSLDDPAMPNPAFADQLRAAQRPSSS